MKELKIALEEVVNLKDLIKVLGEYQKQIYNSSCNWLKFHFNWECDTKEFVEMRRESMLYNWLYPIKFSNTLAFIIDIMQNNINFILTNREKTFEIICSKLKMDLDYFYKSIEDIQNLLIEFDKVKVCKDGRVVIMNDVW